MRGGKSCELCARHCIWTPSVAQREVEGEMVGVCEKHRDGILKAPLSKAKPDFGPVYAGKVGSKGGGASSDKAEAIAIDVSAAQREILHLLAKFGPCGAEDFAKLASEQAYLKEPRLRDADYVSPRLSELKAKGLVLKGPKTARTARGNKAHAYLINSNQEQAA